MSHEKNTQTWQHTQEVPLQQLLDALQLLREGPPVEVLVHKQLGDPGGWHPFAKGCLDAVVVHTSSSQVVT